MKRYSASGASRFARFGINYRNINRVSSYRGGVRL